MDRKAIIDRITAFLQSDDIIGRLASMPTKDLNSLQIFLYEKRAQGLSVDDILQSLSSNRFVQPSATSQRKLIAFDRLAYECLPDDFTGVELSPVAPFGVNSVLAGTDQKNVMTGIRSVEVIADPTTSLALEAVRRRRDLINLGIGGESDVKLASSVRSLRTQDFSDIPGFKPHFRIFALVTSWDNSYFPEEEVGSTIEHLDFYLKLLGKLPEIGYELPEVSVCLSDISITEVLIAEHHLDRKELGRQTQNPRFDFFTEAGINLPSHVPTLALLDGMQTASRILHSSGRLRKLEDEVIARLRPMYPSVNFEFDLGRLAGIGYYQGLCFKVSARNVQGDVFPLVDAAFTGWASKLLRSKNERMLASGIGTEIVCQNF